MLKNLALIFVAMLCWQTATYAQSFDAGTCPTAVAIPDNDPAGVDVNIVTSGLATTLGSTLILEQVNLQITHTWNADVDITLTAPDGVTTVEISTDNGGSGDNYGDGNGCTALASFTMSSANPPVTGVGTSNITGTFLPEGDFADFNNGLDPNGTWTLNVADDASGDVGTVEFVELVFAAPPACPAPSSPTATAITTTSVDLGWTQGGTVSSWDVEWGTVGFTQGTGTMVTGTTTNPYSLTGLTANTTYEFYVRANCGSAWIGPLSFTTACATFTAPYTEDFENAGAIPSCWNQGASNSEDWLFANTAAGNHIGNNGTAGGVTTSGNYFAWINDSSPDNTGTTLESPLVDVSGLTTPMLYFYLISNNEGHSNVDFSVDVWDGAAWNTGVYTSNTNTANGEWEQIFVDLSTLTITGPVQLRFIVDEPANGDFYDDVAIDDVKIDEAPTCIQPTALTVTNITSTSVDLGWTSSASVWDVEWDTVGFTQGTGTMVTGTTTNPHSLTGLTANTTYSFYVRADCSAGGNGSSLWTGPFTFTTTVACPDPTNPMVSNITSSSADLSWSQTGGISSWDVEWDTVGFTQGTGTMVTGTTTNPHNLTGLMANTTYSFYVRANCGSGWAGPFTFTTACNAFVAPYLEEFAVASLPSCWTEGGATTWGYGSNGTTPTGFARYGAEFVADHSAGGTGTFIGMDGSYNTNGEVSILLSPFVDVSALTTPELSYWVFKNNVNNAAQNKLIVELYDGAVWNVVDSIQSNLDTTWVEFTTNLTAYTITGDVQVRFTITGDNSMGGNTYNDDILIDDVALRNAPLADLVISEIMYNPAEAGTDTTEFIEIYNNGASAVDLTGYTFSSGVVHTFASGTIAAGDYFVIAVDTAALNTVFGAVSDDEWTSGGLSNGGEPIALKDNFGRMVDSLRYDDNAPWSTHPDGNGSSIVLCDVNTDNQDGANWSRSYTPTGYMVNGNEVFGSPGAGNNCNAPGDVEMTKIFTMMTDYCGADSVDVYMVFTNNTSNTEANVPFVGTINGTGLPFVHALAPNAVDTIVGRIPTPVSGVYNLGAWTELPGDANMSNDTAAMITIYVSHLAGTATVTSNYNGADISCNGGTDGEATVAVSTAGLGTVGYMWVGNGSTTMMATGLSAGMATAVLTDSIGCVDSAMVMLTEPMPIMPTVDTVMNVTCNGASDGAIILTFAGGTGAYTYLWDNGATVEDITGLAPNTYNGTITDANGCTLATPAGGFTITEPSSVTATATDDATGNSATAAGSGGTVAGAYTFMWDAAASNQTTATATGLTSGNNYCVTITDDNGCTSSACVTVLVTGLDDVANANAFKVYPNPTTGNVFIELSAATTENVQVDLFNATGQNVLSRQLKGQSTRIELNTGELPTGVYMMRFAIENEVSTQKLIIQRP